MNNKDNEPSDFNVLIGIIDKKKQIFSGLIAEFRLELEMIKSHPICSAPESLVRDIEEHIRNYCISLSQWARFSKMLQSKNPNPEFLTTEESDDIGQKFQEALGHDKKMLESWEDIKYEIDSWNESMLELESMMNSVDSSEDFTEEDYYDDSSEDEDLGGFFADEDEDLY